MATGGIVWESVQRLIEPAPVAAGTMMIVAGIGIVVNGFTAFLFMSGHSDLNIRGAFLHMVADAAVSLGVVLGGLAILWTGANWIDPVLSLVIAAVIVWGTWGLLRQSLTLSLHGVPRSIAMPEVRKALERMPGVARVHHLHVWAVSTTETALTAHLVMPGGHPGDRFLAEAQRELKAHFGIGHATLQIEIHRPGSQDHGPDCPLDEHDHGHGDHAHKGHNHGGHPHRSRSHRIFRRNAVSVMILVGLKDPCRCLALFSSCSIPSVSAARRMRLPMAMPAPIRSGISRRPAPRAGATGPALRQGPLHLPHMAALGLGLACEASTGRMPPNLCAAG